MNIIVGTAGHIDHGKTALVKALTGVDADRLPEEKRRGITVDLGFAEMSVGDVHFGLVDVPGHERFVKNMLAGASGIDMVMLVIAADEGVMPQTREHFDICRLLDVKAGVIVLTKSDLVDAETLELAKLDAAELAANSFLAAAPMIPVSSRTGDGVVDLKDALVRISRGLPDRTDQLITRLAIDRSFSVKGFGAVATGTLASGKISEGDEIELLPSKTKVRVRVLQTHGQTVKSALAGQRVAVNLGGIDHSKIERGMLLAEPNVLHTTQIIDAEVEVLPGAAKPLRSRQRVRVHIGTDEVLARVHVLNDVGEIAVGEKDLAQLRFEMPVVGVPGERFIIRSYSPQFTIAGGQVIDTFAAKHRKKEIEPTCRFLNALLSATNNTEKINLIISEAGAAGLDRVEIRARTALRNDIVAKALDTLISSGQVKNAEGRYVKRLAFESLKRSVETALEKFHKQEPLAKGMSREALREKLFAYIPPEIFQSVITDQISSNVIMSDKESIRLSSYQTTLSSAETALREKLFGAYKNAGLEVPKLDEALEAAIDGSKFTKQDARKFFQLFLDSGEIVKVTDEFYFVRHVVDRLTATLREFAAKTGDRSIDVSRFKELAGVSRKYAIPLLEYFDREHVTSRVGDKRVIL